MSWEKENKIKAAAMVTVVGSFNEINLRYAKSATFGGHLLEKNKVYTTAEVVVCELQDVVFNRVHDPESGWDELTIRSN